MFKYGVYVIIKNFKMAVMCLRLKVLALSQQAQLIRRTLIDYLYL